MNGRSEQPSRVPAVVPPHGFRSAETRGKVSHLWPAIKSQTKTALSRSPEQFARVRWEERLSQLQGFKERHGHCNVPRGWHENPSLSYWVINQRYKLRKGELSADRVQRLQESGISWASPSDRIESREKAWTRMYRKIAQLKDAQGHSDAAAGTPPNRKVARWLANQRYLMRTGTLPADRRRKLEALGMLWNVERGRSRARDEAWDRMYSEAKQFEKRHAQDGPMGKRTMPPKLARWIAYQHHRLEHNTLPEDRRRRILDLDLKRHPRKVGDRAWQRMYAFLLEYKQTQGHCEVHRHCPENPRLGRWVSRQRYLLRQGKLPQDRKEALERLGLKSSPPPLPRRKSATGLRCGSSGLGDSAPNGPNR
jgi:hypothetical protein